MVEILGRLQSYYHLRVYVCFRSSYEVRTPRACTYTASLLFTLPNRMVLYQLAKIGIFVFCFLKDGSDKIYQAVAPLVAKIEAKLAKKED